MQYYVSTADVLGTLQDVFTKCNYKFEESKQSESYSKLIKTHQSKLEDNSYKSKLDLYLDKIKKKKQQQDQNASSICNSTQTVDLMKHEKKINESQTAYTLKESCPRFIIETSEQEVQTSNIHFLDQYSLVDKESQSQLQTLNVSTQYEEKDQQQQAEGKSSLTGKNAKTKQIISQVISININTEKNKQQDFQCQVEQEPLQILQKSDGDPQNSYHSLDLMDNLQILNDQVQTDQEKCTCGKLIEKIKKITFDKDCQYESSQVNGQSTSQYQLEQQLKHIRVRSRCMSVTGQINNNQYKLRDEDDASILEKELQLRDEMLQDKFLEIQQLQQQIKDLHELYNNEDRKIIESNSSNENWKVEELNQQLEHQMEIEDQLTKQMLQYSEEVIKLKQSLDEMMEQNSSLKEERDALLINVKQLQEQIQDLSESKVKEIQIISEDYQDKMSKQNMIIDELQSQIQTSLQTSLQPSPMVAPPFMSYKQINQVIGSDSQVSRGSNQRTSEEKQQLLKNIKKMTSMTAGLMSNKQDYTTLGVLGRLDQVKSQSKLESFKKLN